MEPVSLPDHQSRCRRATKEAESTVIDADSLERLVPEFVHSQDTTGTETLALHLERYEFACRYARPGRLLDIACGVGYGTRLLIDQCPGVTEAVGVDLSSEAITYAKQHYQREGLRFVVDDAMRFSDPERFNAIVSLETIEHLPDPESFVGDLVDRLTRPQGVIIASVPTTPSVDANPHHLHDFTERSFRRMFENCGLMELGCLHQVQPFKLMPLITQKESRARDLRTDLPVYYMTHPLSLLRRILSILTYGFANRYITIAWQVPN